jgi:glycolate oxidase FAD binding subunit
MTSATQNSIAEQLGGICGHEYVRLVEGALRVAPADTQQIAAILRYANENGLVVTPYSGGTKQGWGNPVRPALYLDMARLATLREHTWQDLTCTVEAGCTWSSLQARLAQHGQCVALDPLWPGRATVGGAIATNDSGSLRFYYGSLRDLVIGMTIVLADGTIAKTGGKVVKNVAGYDLHKLMIGAFGTLGVITEVTFRLHAIPRHTESHTFRADTASVLAPVLQTIRGGHFSTQRLQLRGTRDGFFLDIELAALPSALATQSQSLSTLARGAALDVHPAVPSVWLARQQILQENSINFKATMLPTDVAYFADYLASRGGTSVAQAQGLMTAAIDAEHADLLPSLREEFAKRGGTLTLLQAHATLDPWGVAPDTLPLMREVKRRFDPNSILNRGRFLGEI